MDRFQSEPFFLDCDILITEMEDLMSKKLFLEAYHKGQTARSILEDYGFDPDILGNRRIWGISSHIRSDYQKYGEFTEGHKTRDKRSSKWSWQINGDEWSACHLVDHCGI